MSRFVVRAYLADGSVVRDGGYASLDSASSHAQRWVSTETFRSRDANGALPCIAAIVLLDGAVVAKFAAPSGRSPEFTA